ncbi:MAG: hypothetical protein NVS4B1_33360 [Ktedonobacteraceae bacterium]
MANESFTTVADPRDVTYNIRRQEQIDEMLKLSPQQLDRRLNWQMNSPDRIRDDHNMTAKSLGDMVNSPMLPAGVRKSILDTTGGTTGNVLIRQDLEPTLYALVGNRAFSE